MRHCLHGNSLHGGLQGPCRQGVLAYVSYFYAAVANFPIAHQKLTHYGLQAVEMFLDEKIGYMDIVKTVEKCCETHQQELLQKPSLEEIVHYDQWAREWGQQQCWQQTSCGSLDLQSVL